MRANEVARILDALARGAEIAKPNHWPEIGLDTPDSRQVRFAIHDNTLTGLTDRRKTDESVRWADSVLLAIIHDAANHHRAEHRPEEAQREFKRLLEMSPGDYNVRVALATYADPVLEPEVIYDLLKPSIDIYRANPEVYDIALNMFAQSVFVKGDLLEAIQMVDHFRAMAGGEAYAERIEMFSTVEFGDVVTPAEQWLSYALLALDESRALECLRKAAEVRMEEEGARESFGRRAVICAQVMRRMGWDRPYRLACEMTSAAFSQTSSPRALQDLWIARDLPATALPVLMRGADLEACALQGVDSGVADGWCKALLADAESLGFEDGPAHWVDLWRQGLFDRFLNLTPHVPSVEGGGGALAALREAALAVVDAPHDQEGVDLWFFMTWHEDPHQLIRLISALIARKVMVVVSIGGAGLPANLGLASIPLMLDGFDFIFNPVVTWGGQRLLFHNVFTGLEALARRAPDDARFQVICNRTYPLLPPGEISALLAAPDFTERFPGQVPPPVWRQEWPEDVVANLPAIFDGALDDIFKYANGDAFHSLSTIRGMFDDSDFRKNGVAFNFAATALPLEANYKSSAHAYLVSPFAADMRWMSYARLTEFVDVSVESMTTYSRRLHPLVERWNHSVLIKHDLRTGDPFFMTTPKLAREVLTNPDCIELFAVMNTGFGPEMNYFDTIAMTPSYGLQGHVEHLYYRTASGHPGDADIKLASYAADNRRQMFVRKTARESVSFVEHFAGRIDAWRGHESYFVALTGELSATAPSASVGINREFLEVGLVGRSCRLRTLFGAPLAEAVFQTDGEMRSPTGERLGEWRWTDDGGLEISYVRREWGSKTYPFFVSDGVRLTLVPAEIVSVRNLWSVFIDMDLDGWLESPPSGAIIDDNLAMGALERPVMATGASLEEAALLGAFATEDRPDFCGVWQRHDYSLGLIRRGDDGVFASISVDGVPTLGRIARVAYGDSRAVAVLELTTPSIPAIWKPSQSETASENPLGLSASALVGAWRLRLLELDVAFELAGDGRVLTAEGGALGVWTSIGARVWIVGLAEAPIIVASQFVWTSGAWSMSGWCSRTLGDITSFSIEPATRKSPDKHEKIA